jgi:methanogenic corrinoid protein MtbC1
MPTAAITEDLGALQSAYVEAILAPDARRARTLVEAACDRGVPPERIYLDVLQPALHEVGRRWEQARLSVAGEHLATQITQAVLAALAARMTRGRSGAGRRALVSCSPGERHVLGGQMVADFLDAGGWDVLSLGADTPAPDLARLAAAERVDVVALSTALPGHLIAVGRACAHLRRLPEPPFVVVGGQAFGGDERRALAVGADAYAPDPQALLEILGDQFGARVD